MTRRASAALVAGLMATPVFATADEGNQEGAARPQNVSARAAFAAVKARSGQAHAVWRNDQLALLTRVRIPTQGADTVARVQRFLTTHAGLFGAVDLVVSDVDVRPTRAIVRLDQTHPSSAGPLPVIERSVILTLDAQGAVTRVVNDSVALRGVDAARIDADTAADIAWAHVHDAARPQGPIKARKVVFASADRGVEGYVVLIARGPLAVFEVRVNGVDGSVFGVQSQAQW